MALLLAACLVAFSSIAAAAQVIVSPEIPRIDGAWWRVARNPDLGAFTSPAQQPVDFAIWQAADGTWQICSCIRHTLCGGATRLFHRWEGRRLTDPDWKPMGIALLADPRLGETLGGLQAPHVFRANGVYFMVYGDWQRICLARSTDGKEWKRVLNVRGEPDLFTGPYDNTRDPMVLKIGGLYHCYYMGHRAGAQFQSAAFCRTSPDLAQWTAPTMVAAGGIAARQTPWFGGDAECPFVVAKNGMYYLSRTQVYGPNGQSTWYASTDPLAFGVGDDRYRIGTLPVTAPEIVFDQGQYYIAALEPNLDGIRIARLRWAPR